MGAGRARGRLRRRDDEDVRGLQVAVDDAALVRVADGAADRLEEAEAIVQLRLRRVRAAHVLAHVVAERLPGDQLHREEVLAVRRAAGLVERGDVGMDQPRQRLGLAAEEAQPQLVERVPRATTLSATRRFGFCCSAS